MRNTYSNENNSIRILMAKTKLAPKKTISVAKMELQAALLGTRLTNFVGQAVTRKINSRYFWIVYHIIGEIQTLTEAKE